MGLDKSVEVIRFLIRNEMFKYINGMFEHVTDTKLNDILEKLSIVEREELYPYLSPDVQEKIAAGPSPKMPLQWVLTSLIIIAAALTTVTLLWKLKSHFKNKGVNGAFTE